ncbi:response regulator [Asticcacaulis benevestitus]|uniref:Response regulatory domain-containing protein n=1 Tax=Asticcacaulis benevestitus DSM 16100 = ATCC BAA-896 TaxID=1121022 RepID=V4P3C4_9CAUL|nr:response regulator [Asticcacaulis benevestitus]ESQ81649.1 hypothetical protein ABENE_21615 [Asticcacaulis benevestitus DSM 16100 = ATCC BAA-896]
MTSTDTSVPAGALRILIVEDNHAAAQATGLMIEAMGHDYLIAHTPGQALMTAEAYAPDVALIDIELPGMSGFDLCRELRALPELQKTLCIAQTGWQHDDYRHRADSAGFHHFLVKPVYFDVLNARLTEIAAERPAS